VKVFVDTSALLAILDEDDAHHAEAAATFRSLVARAELVTHNYIHVEAGALVGRRLGAAALDALTGRLLPAMTTMWIDEELHHAALAERGGRAGGPSLVDEVSFVVLRRSGINEAFAFDGDFEAQGFRRPRVEAQRGHRLGEARASYGLEPPRGVGEERAPEATELVSVAEISARSGRPTNTIQSWRRRHADFPVPIATLAAGPVWQWPDVARWISSRGSVRSSGVSSVGLRQ
jgi:predicted nucleic acid-binding protein